MAVILEVPVLYTAHYVPRGHRNDRSAQFMTRVAVRVPEIGGDRAPVVARATFPSGREVAYRSLGDGLLRPLRLPMPDGPVALDRDNAQAALDAFVASLDRGPNAKAVRWPFLPEAASTHRTPMTEPGDYRMITRSDKEERIRAFRDAWQHASAFVDGVLHVQSKGPAWKVVNRVAPGSKPHLEPAEEAGWLGASAFARDEAFAPDRLALAEIRTYERAACGDLAIRNSDMSEYLRGLGPTLGAIEAPRTLPGDELLRLEVAAAAKSQLHIAASDLAHKSPEAIRAYADLKEAHARGAEGGDLGRLAEALRGFRGACAAPSRHVKEGDDPVLRLLERLGPGAAPGGPRL